MLARETPGTHAWTLHTQTFCTCCRYDVHSQRSRAESLAVLRSSTSSCGRSGNLRWPDWRVFSHLSFNCRLCPMLGVSNLDHENYSATPLHCRLHQLHHMSHGLRTSLVSWRWVTCLDDEDYVGKFARLCRSCHPASLGKRALQRWRAFMLRLWGGHNQVPGRRRPKQRGVARRIRKVPGAP